LRQQRIIKFESIVWVPIALILILTLGTLGFVLIEDSGLLDALYMTVITISTVGYGEVVELSPAGRVFTIGLIMLAVGTVMFGFGVLTHYVVEGELNQIFGRRRVEKRVRKMEGHYIICGYGRIGKRVCAELEKTETKFTIIEKNPDEAEQAESEGYTCIRGSATEEETLLKAGIKRAAGLVATLATDADNVFAVLTAREMNPNLYIIARVLDEGSEGKLYRAGAHHVVAPYRLGGMRIANAILRPAVVELLDLAVFDKEHNLQMEQIYIPPASWIVGKNLIQSQLRSKYGFVVIGIRKKGKQLIFNPDPELVIEAEDMLVIVGERDDLSRFQKALGTGEQD